MSESKVLKPVGDRKVRHPDGRHLRGEGERVVMTTYWRRRLAGKEVEEVNPAPPAGKQSGSSASKAKPAEE